MSRLLDTLRRATAADVAVAAGVLAIVVALLGPAWRAGAFRDRLAAAVADVDAVAGAARTHRELRGSWPTASPPGEAPPELGGLGGPDGPFSRVGYTLAWTTWAVVDSADAPPEAGPPPAPGDAPRQPTTPRQVPVTRAIGAVGVRTAEESVLAELLRHYGTDVSLVVDSMWLLLLPERAPVASRGP